MAACIASVATFSSIRTTTRPHSLFPLSIPTRPIIIPHYPSRRSPILFSLSHPLVSSSSSPPRSIESKPPPIPQPLLRGALLCALACLSFCGAAAAAAAAGDSIRASGLGLKVAAALRRSGWADDAIVFALAALPVLELRGAIPVGYWMHLHPLRLSLLSVLGNMLPVPLLVLGIKPLAARPATGFLRLLFEKARKKAAPVEEFQWLGLMLFVAVPFPGTGAWTGAVIAALLDMPFWDAISANFIGVVIAGLLVNLLVNLGLKYALGVGVVLFVVSTVMWSVLRRFKEALDSSDGR